MPKHIATVRRTFFFSVGILVLLVCCGFKTVPATHTTPAQYTQLGNILANNGDFVGAEKTFNLALERDQAYIPAYIGRAFLFIKQGKRDQAVAEYNKITEIQPDNSEAYISKGLLFLNLDQRDLAEKNFDKACELGNQSGCTFKKEMFEQKMFQFLSIP